QRRKKPPPPPPPPKKRPTKPPASDQAKAAARECLERYRELQDDQVDLIMHPDPAVDFAAQRPEIEAEAVRLYDASNSKIDLGDFNPPASTNSPKVNNFRWLWKVCLRVFNRSPVKLISPINGMKYRTVLPPGSRQDAATRPSEVIFSPDFSSQFTDLIVHPCWESGSVTFILALQFTVKCRTDNRAPWPSKKHADFDPTLTAIREMFDNLDGEADSLEEMFERARDSQPEGTTSTFSDFLHFLGGQVKRTPTDAKQPQEYLGLQALPVTVKDLKTLKGAVKDFEWNVESWDCSPEEIFKAYKKEVGTAKDELPRDHEQVKAYTSRSLLDIYRYIAIRQQDPEPPSRDVPAAESPSVDSELGAPQEEADTDRENRPDISMEDRPIIPLRRYKALVGGEESEDEEEDLRRNQENESFEPDSIPQFHLQSPYVLPNASGQPFRQRDIPTLPATPRTSGVTLSQLGLPSDNRLEKRVEAAESSIQHVQGDIKHVQGDLKLLKGRHNHLYTSMQRMKESHEQDIRLLRQEVQSHSQPQVEVETNDTALARRVEAIGTENATLVSRNQELQAQLDQAVQEKVALSEKVEALELENTSLFEGTSERDKALEIERQRVRDLEAELAAVRDREPETEEHASITEGHMMNESNAQRSSDIQGLFFRMPKPPARWFEGEGVGDAAVDGSEVLGSRRTRNLIVLSFDDVPEYASLRQRNCLK
ncbi:hypothetical protein IL306_011540, partial [Fusarium sp. DS 682]